MDTFQSNAGIDIDLCDIINDSFNEEQRYWKILR